MSDAVKDYRVILHPVIGSDYEPVIRGMLRVETDRDNASKSGRRTVVGFFRASDNQNASDVMRVLLEALHARGVRLYRAQAIGMHDVRLNHRTKIDGLELMPEIRAREGR